MGRRYLIMTVDQQAYGSKAEIFQTDLQHGLVDTVEAAAAAADLRSDLWQRQIGGDSLLAVMSDERETNLVHRFVTHLNDELIQYNKLKSPDAELRLRLAVHFGPAEMGANGFIGSGAVKAARMRDCRQAKTALTATGAPLAVVVSQIIYEDTVLAGRVPIDPSRLRRIRVHNKEHDEDAWLWVPGHDINALDLDGPGAAGDSTGPAAPGSTAGATQRSTAQAPPGEQAAQTVYRNFEGAANYGQAAGRDFIINNFQREGEP
jgi:hypothetical protein